MQENVIRALQEDEARRGQAISLIRQGLELLENGGLQAIEGGKGNVTPLSALRYMGPGGYIPAVVAILAEAGEPMKVADIVSAMQEQAAFMGRPRNRLRQAVERSVWLEVTKRKNPRLARHGKKGGGTYWLTKRAQEEQKKAG